MAFMTITALVVLTSCGSGDDETVETVSKQELVNQADQVCSKTEKRQLALVGKFEKSKSGKDSQASPAQAEEELVTFAGLPPIEQQIQELSDLPTPESGAGQFTAYLEALKTGLATAEKDPSSLLASGADPFAEAISAAEQFGLKVCAGA